MTGQSGLERISAPRLSFSHQDVFNRETTIYPRSLDQLTPGIYGPQRATLNCLSRELNLIGGTPPESILVQAKRSQQGDIVVTENLIIHSLRIVGFQKHLKKHPGCSDILGLEYGEMLRMQSNSMKLPLCLSQQKLLTAPSSHGYQIRVVLIFSHHLIHLFNTKDILYTIIIGEMCV
ncbi:hypothetical protein AVEN_116337-1 [Araneus ventricosus]|uniref:Uncharacterized protein n=1 Tax=Araneus ventricosus TaxID=182803 RepID=A0A4Y2V1M0_ARAVE|nr:hypothetical protein AVEN_116337-1 [Araneus ventricosus]